MRFCSRPVWRSGLSGLECHQQQQQQQQTGVDGFQVISSSKHKQGVINKAAIPFYLCNFINTYIYWLNYTGKTNRQKWHKTNKRDVI
jgi:hypothetical protein